ncbi:MAG: POTRA domain-containing protein [Bryobacteraceae bacterium]
MTRTRILLATALTTALAAALTWPAALLAQTQTGATSFQQAQSLGEPLGPLGVGRGGRGVAANTVPIPRQEAGRPFSATATTQTTQTLIDGTHVNQTITMRQYRDADGRVRMEPREPGALDAEPARSITIYDPVGGAIYHLDPAKKTVTKQVTIPAAGASTASEGGGRRGGRGDGASGSNSDTEPRMQQRSTILRAMAAAMRAAKNNPNHIVEDLGTATVNGVSARGTRITTVVPVGAIGNDKEFRSVTERWFSPDLNLLIKSVSTDPRFGTTTYELTNINRQSPDAPLFQVPADYNIVSTQPTLTASKVIEAVEFRGASHVSPETLKATVLSKPGDVYDEEALRRDFSALWKTNRFSDVQLKTEPGARGGVIVRFVLTERP